MMFTEYNDNMNKINFCGNFQEATVSNVTYFQEEGSPERKLTSPRLIIKCAKPYFIIPYLRSYLFMDKYCLLS